MDPSRKTILLDPATGAGRSLADHGNDVLLALLEDAPEVAKELLDGDADDRVDAQLVFRSVAAIMVEGLRRRKTHVFDRGVEAIKDIWELGNPAAMRSSRTPSSEASLWENLVLELFAVGAVAVHLRSWEQVRLVASLESAGSGEGLLRQGQVASARSATDQNDTICDLVSQRIRTLAADLVEDSATRDFAVFDLYSALVAVELGLRYGYYTNAAVLDAEIVEPFIIEQLRDPASGARANVFVGDEDSLRAAIREYEWLARCAAANYRYAGQSWLWRGFADARTLTWLASGGRQEDWGPGAP